MNTLIDIVGSSVIGLYFVYMIMSFNFKMNDSINTAALNNGALWDSITLGQIADYDFNKVGFRTDSVFVFGKAEETAIEFYGDLENNGFVDTVQYILIDSNYIKIHGYTFNGKANPASNTFNDDDMPLYRIVNGSVNSPDKTVSLVTDFSIIYFDSDGDTITTSLATHTARKEIKGFTINFTTESPSPVITMSQTPEIKDFDTTYQSIDWEKRYSPKNIN